MAEEKAFVVDDADRSKQQAAAKIGMIGSCAGCRGRRRFRLHLILLVPPSLSSAPGGDEAEVVIRVPSDFLIDKNRIDNRRAKATRLVTVATVVAALS